MSAIDVSPDHLITLAERGWEHSDLYRYMIRHFDRLATSFLGRRLKWDELCGWFRQVGLNDFTGKSPEPGCARKTWYRVRKAMARAKERVAATLAKAEDEAEAKRAQREARRQAPPHSAQRYAAPAVRRPVMATAPVVAPVKPGAASAGDPLTEFTPEQLERIEMQKNRIRKQLRRENRWRGGDYADA